MDFLSRAPHPEVPEPLEKRCEFLIEERGYEAWGIYLSRPEIVICYA
jgi:hypothetical protein